MFRLDNFSTVVMAEGRAIGKAVDYVFNNLENYETLIISDSLSSISAIINLNEVRVPFGDIRTQIKNHGSLLWMKAHNGNPGNELGNAIAKKSLGRDTIDIDYYLNNKVLRRRLYRTYLRIWQNQWDQRKKGRPVSNLIKEVSYKKLYSDFYINQIITGHGPYRLRLYGRCDVCICGSSIGDIDHIKYCTLTNDIRTERPNFHWDNILITGLMLTYTDTVTLRKVMKIYFEYYVVSL